MRFKTVNTVQLLAQSKRSLKRFYIRMVLVRLRFSPRTSGKVQMLQTPGQCSVPMVSAVKAVSRTPGAFVFDIVT